MELKVGSRWTSAVSDVEIAVIKSPKRDIVLACGDQEVLPLGTEKSGYVVISGDDEMLLGKRYTNQEGDLEILVTKGGSGILTADGAALVVKSPKPLPSSD